MIRLRDIVAKMAKAKYQGRTEAAWADEWMKADHASRFDVSEVAIDRLTDVVRQPIPDRPGALRKLCADFDLAVPDEIALVRDQMELL